MIPALYVTGPHGGARHILPEGLVSLGRGAESTIVVDDPRVSRAHAALQVGVDLQLSDLGSANGTSLGGERLRPGESRPLALGESFFIGDSALVVRATSLRREASRRVATLDEVRARFLAPTPDGGAGSMVVLRASGLRPRRTATWEIIIGDLLDSPRDWMMWTGTDQVLIGMDVPADQGRPHLEREVLRHFFGWGAAAEVESRLLSREQVQAAGDDMRAFFLGDRPLMLNRGKIVLQDQAMLALKHSVDRVASAPVNVLILGETGAGKDVIASMIHEGSTRAEKPFVGLNCASFPESLLESELFGYERGAFTGAVAAKPGLLENASGGTVFLDEIGDLSQGLQAKLLRAIESHEVLRLGSLKARVVDVRFVAATNRDLREEVEAGRFRRDLFYRLNTVTLTVPPLRDRPSEIDPLASLFLQSACARFGLPPLSLSPGAFAALIGHSWPGNVRELRNVIERAALLCPQAIIEAAHLGLPVASAAAVASPPVNLAAETTGKPAAPVDEPDTGEKERIAGALMASGWNQSRAAKALGIPRRTLVRLIARLGLPRPRMPND